MSGKVGGAPCPNPWFPSLPSIPYAGDSKVQGMVEAVKPTVVGLGVCCRRYDTMFYWSQACTDSTKYLVQMLTDDNVFTFLEVSQGSDGVTQLCKLHPSVRVTPGELPKVLPIPHPEPCMMNLNPLC